MSDHFFKSLKIERFRGIEFLEIEDLARVNLFVGKNSTGKTTVLESVFLLTGISRPQLAIAIDHFRGSAITSGSSLRDYFYCRDHESGLRLSGKQSKHERDLTVEPLYMEQLQRVAASSKISGDGIKRPPQMGSASSDMGLELRGLKYSFKIFDGSNWSDPCEPKIWLKEESSPESSWNVNVVENYNEELLAKFDSPRLFYDKEAINHMLKNKQKKLILDAIKIIESRIIDIMVAENGIVLIDVGYDSFMPINLLGDGMIQILKLISQAASIPDGIYAVDEIGNGLHVSAIRGMWEMIFAQSKERNTQIFATTHSKDVVEALQEMMANGKIEEGEVSTYLLDKTPKAGVKAYKQSTKQMVRAWECGSDIRI